MNTVISHQFSILQARLDQLTCLLKKAPRKWVEVTPIPAIRKGMENEAITEMDIESFSDNQALTLATACYQDLHIKPGLSQKSARRVPGIIWVPEPCDQAEAIQEAVGDINNAKAIIKTFITNEYHTRQARFNALRSDCPGIMTLHLYRQIRCHANENMASIRFSWEKKAYLHKPDKAAFLQKILSEREDDLENRLALEQLYEKVYETPPALLRTRRPIKVQPVANMVINGEIKTVTASMPIIIIQSENINIKMLPSLTKSSRKKRSDRVASTVLGTFHGETVEAFPA